MLNPNLLISGLCFCSQISDWEQKPLLATPLPSHKSCFDSGLGPARWVPELPPHPLPGGAGVGHRQAGCQSWGQGPAWGQASPGGCPAIFCCAPTVLACESYWLPVAVNAHSATTACAATWADVPHIQVKFQRLVVQA